MHSSEEVYITDHMRTMNADLVVFIVNVPSLGVGIETQVAADATVPKVVVHYDGAAVSRMFHGAFSPTIAEISYSSPDAFREQLRSQLSEITVATQASAARRKPHRLSISRARLGRSIFEGRIRRKMPITTLAQFTDVREYWLRQLERSDDNAACLTLMQLMRVASTLKCEIFMGSNGVPELQFDPLPEHAGRSLQNLIEAVLSDETWKADQRIFDAWTQNVEEQFDAVAGRSDLRQPITVEQWKAFFGGRLF